MMIEFSAEAELVGMPSRTNYSATSLIVKVEMVEFSIRVASVVSFRDRYGLPPFYAYK
jgi:hypothetical protein